jgi:hypothetical protein
MSLRDELMIPFQGIGEVGHALRAGSAVLVDYGKQLIRQALRRLPRPGKSASFGDKVELVVMGTFGAIGAVLLTAGTIKLLLRLATPYLGWIAGGVTAAWIVAALLVAPQALPARGNVEEPESPAPPRPAQVLAQFVKTVAAKHGQRGVHLDDLLPHLPGIDRQGLLAALREAGIPVKEQLKLRTPNGKQRNRQGIRVDDIPADLLGTGPGASSG